MDVILPKDRATLVEFYPPLARPVSATVRFLDASGSVVTTPAASVDTLSRTIVTATDTETYTVSGATGSHAAGRYYWWTAGDSTMSALVMLSEVVSPVWYLGEGPPTMLALAGDTFKGARLTTTITAEAAVNLGENYRIEWTVTGADGVVRIYDQVAHVTRKDFRPSVDPTAARTYFNDSWPDLAGRRRFGFFVRIATKATARVWRRIRKMGRYVHLLADSDDFTAAGLIALERECAAMNLIPAGIIDAQAYRDSLDAQLNAEIEDVISSRPYDENADNALDETETKTVNAIALRRW